MFFWIRLFIALLAFTTLFSAPSFAVLSGDNGHLSLFLGPNLSSNRVANRNPKVINSYAVGFESGFSFEKFLISDIIGIEPGLTYLVRSFRVDTPLQQVETTLPAIELPVMLRFWPVNFLSFSGGAYVTYGLSPAEQTTTPLNGPASVQRGSYHSLGFRPLDYGLVGSTRAAFSVVPSTRVFFELRYRHSLVNISSDPIENVLLRTGSLLGGLQFQF